MSKKIYRVVLTGGPASGKNDAHKPHPQGIQAGRRLARHNHSRNGDGAHIGLRHKSLRRLHVHAQVPGLRHRRSDT